MRTRSGLHASQCHHDCLKFCPPPRYFLWLASANRLHTFGLIKPSSTWAVASIASSFASPSGDLFEFSWKRCWAGRSWTGGRATVAKACTSDPRCSIGPSRWSWFRGFRSIVCFSFPSFFTALLSFDPIFHWASSFLLIADTDPLQKANSHFSVVCSHFPTHSTEFGPGRKFKFTFCILSKVWELSSMICFEHRLPVCTYLVYLHQHDWPYYRTNFFDMNHHLSYSAFANVSVIIRPTIILFLPCLAPFQLCAWRQVATCTYLLCCLKKVTSRAKY